MILAYPCTAKRAIIAVFERIVVIQYTAHVAFVLFPFYVFVVSTFTSHICFIYAFICLNLYYIFTVTLHPLLSRFAFAARPMLEGGEFVPVRLINPPLVL